MKILGYAIARQSLLYCSTSCIHVVTQFTIIIFATKKRNGGGAEYLFDFYVFIN